MKEYKVLELCSECERTNTDRMNMAACEGFELAGALPGFCSPSGSTIYPMVIMVRNTSPAGEPAPRPDVFKGPAEQYMDKP